MPKVQKVPDVHRLAKPYKIAKAKSGFTDENVADMYMSQNFTMISKVLAGRVTSKPVEKKIHEFILDVDPNLLKQ